MSALTLSSLIASSRRRSTPPAADPYFGLVTFLIPFDQPAGSSTIVDSRGHPLTPYGSVALSTTYPKFGRTCGYFDGSSGYLEASSPDVALNIGDFCIEGFMRPMALTQTYHILVDTRDTTNNIPGVLIWVNNAGELHGAHYGNQDAIATGVVVGKWQHFAVIKNGIQLRVYLNGIVGAQESNQSYPLPDFTSQNLYIGQTNEGGNFYNGYLQQLRITKGSFRNYVNNSVVPTGPYIDSISSYYKDWSSGSITNQTLESTGGSQTVTNNQLILYSQSAGYHTESTLDDSPPCINFDATMVGVVDPNGNQCSFLARTTVFSPTNDTYGYVFDFSNAGVGFGHGSNTGTGQYTNISSFSMTLTPGSTQSLRVVAQGSNFTFYLNGTLLGTVNDTTFNDGSIFLHSDVFHPTVDLLVLQVSLSHRFKKHKISIYSPLLDGE